MKIEKGTPLPKARGGSGTRKYPWPDMEVGDSIFFENECAATQSRPAISARGYASKYGKKFATRAEGTGVRIWRVE